MRTNNQISILIQNASVIMHRSGDTKMHEEIVTAYNATIQDESKKISHDAHITIEQTYINDDTLKDVIATIHSPHTCGTGGCITSIFLKADTGKYEPIHFEYAVKSITVENSITNGMHDIRLNNDTEHLFEWNGTEYSLNGV